MEKGNVSNKVFTTQIINSISIVETIKVSPQNLGVSHSRKVRVVTRSLN